MAKVQVKKKEDRSNLNHDHLEVVRDQYEDLPYPPRNPEDDKHRLMTTCGDGLALISHRAFDGKLQFDKLRVLTAGGGTGDATIYYAEQLRNYPEAEVVYVDFSEHSMSIAKRRAEIRGLKNIKFVHGSLLECKDLGIGEFDIINCAGVLHHLENPDAGLRALKEVLKPDGIMKIMLYGYYGRLEIYMIQDTLKILNRDAKTNQERVDMAKALLTALPPMSLMVQQKKKWMYELTSGDGAVFDLLCHPQDRAYKVPEVKDFLDQAGLNIVTFFGVVGGRSQYDAKYLYSKNPAVASHIDQLNKWDKWALAELASSPIKHNFLCGIQDKEYPEIKLEKDSIICFSTKSVVEYHIKRGVDKLASDEAPLSFMIGFNKGEVSFKQFNRKSPETRFLLEVDERRSVEEIYEDMAKSYEDISKMSIEEFIKMAERIYIPLESFDMLCAIKKGTGIIRKWHHEKQVLLDELED